MNAGHALHDVDRIRQTDHGLVGRGWILKAWADLRSGTTVPDDTEPLRARFHQAEAYGERGGLES